MVTIQLKVHISFDLHPTIYMLFSIYHDITITSWEKSITKLRYYDKITPNIPLDNANKSTTKRTQSPKNIWGDRHKIYVNTAGPVALFAHCLVHLRVLKYRDSYVALDNNRTNSHLS